MTFRTYWSLKVDEVPVTAPSGADKGGKLTTVPEAALDPATPPLIR